MGSDLTIRPAKLPDDIAKLRSFIVAEALDMNIPQVDVPTRLDEFLASAGVPWDVFLVAHVGKAFAGFAVISTNGKFSASHAGSLRIQVGAAHRGSGVGSALLTQALEWADVQGLVRITATPYIGVDAALDTTFSPSAGRKVDFFVRHRFVLEGVAHKFAKAVEGGYADAALMARIADPVLL